MTTSASDLINPEQKQQFDESGYCVVDGLFAQNEIQDIEDFFEEYRRSGAAVYDGNVKNFDDIDKTKAQVRAMHPHRYSSKVLKWYLNPNVATVLEILFGKPALGAQTMYYFKPPGSKGQGMHQDNFYLLSKPATCIAAWTAIDTADLDNGCLYVVPGSHRGDILCPNESQSDRWMNYGDSHIGKFPRDLKAVPVPVKRGETLFFGGNLIHGSGPNRTADRWRRTFIGHYIDDASEQVSHFYHPVLNMQGEVAKGNINPYAEPGVALRGRLWQGGVH